MVEKVVVMNCHVQQKVKVGKTVCEEASVVPWEVHFSERETDGHTTTAYTALTRRAVKSHFKSSQ